MEKKTLKERIPYWHAIQREDRARLESKLESKKQKREEPDEWRWLSCAIPVVKAVWPWATILNGSLLLYDDEDTDIYVIAPPDRGDNIINEATVITQILTLLGFQQEGGMGLGRSGGALDSNPPNSLAR